MKKKRSGKREKVHLVFDEQERRDFLLGFHKRKLERKQRAQDEMNKMMKEERKNMKIKQKKDFRDALLSQRTVPEVEHLLEPVTYELPEHTITISDLDLGNGFLSGIVHDSVKTDSNDEGATNMNKEEDTAIKKELSEDIRKTLKTESMMTFKKSADICAAKVAQKTKDKKKTKRLKSLQKKKQKKVKMRKKLKSKK